MTTLKKLFPKKTQKLIENIDQLTAVNCVNDISYSLLDVNKNVVRKHNHQACFHYLPRQVYQTKKNTRYLHYKQKPDFRLTTIQAEAWLNLCQRQNLLPVEPDAKTILAEGFTFDLAEEKLSIDGLYLQLMLLRLPFESPLLVKSVLELVEIAGRDFWAAFHYAHKIGVTNSNHTILPFCKVYDVPSHSFADRNVIYTFSLYQVNRNLRRFDKRFPLETWKKTSEKWNWFGHTFSRRKKPLIVKERVMLLADALVPIITAKTSQEAHRLANLLNKEETHVEFENSSSK